MKLLLLALLALTSTAHANGPWKVDFQDEKLPTQAVLEHYKAASPVLGSTTLVAPLTVLPNGSALSITSFSAQPDYPRNITLTSSGSTGSVGAGTAVVSGVNIHGKAISENFAITAALNGTVTGSKAFASVSSVVIPGGTGVGAKWGVGVGTKLGLHRCMDDAGKYAFSEFAGAYETTRGVAAASSSAIESNTFVPNGTMNGSSAVEVFFVQNFRCYPGQ